MKLLGGLLLAIGVLIAGLSGLCSLAVIASAVPGMSARQVLDGLPVVLIFGGIPIATGTGLILLGLHLIRRSNRDGH